MVAPHLSLERGNIMLDSATLKAKFNAIAQIMADNCDYLVELDRQNGDGDLGFSMKSGFGDTAAALEASDETDLGRLFLLASRTFNESAPSSLGTILSIGMMGTAKALKGSQTATAEEASAGLKAGLQAIMDRTGSSLGEKTILDSLAPGIEALASGDLAAAAEAAANGSEATKQMLAKHGRAAYYGEKSLGILDGGSVVGRLIFEAIAK